MTPKAHHASYTLLKFVDDDPGFLSWKRQNPQGFVVNCNRQPSAGYVVLHRATCSSLSRGRTWTRDSIKICSDHRSILDGWGRSTVNADLRDCRLCHPRG